jgi:dolichol-phosphate mannosyltransferase
MKTHPQINIVIPLYNEEKVFDSLVSRLRQVLDKSPIVATVIMVDDGSKDRTFDFMRHLALADSRFTAVKLSRNFGHQHALTAGLSLVDATEGVFVLDGDLQDPPELLDQFYTKLKEGYDVVYAVRKKRKESFFKKLAYTTFYRLLKRVSMIDIPLDSGDFGLMSRRVADNLNAMPEESRFMRGMRYWVGYNQIGLPYERNERELGESKYNFKKLWQLAFNGIFNFSEYPIKFISNLGLFTASISIVYFLVTVAKKLFIGTVPEGFTAIVFLIILFGGVQLLAIGIIGEYVLRIFFQVKNRPLFLIDQVVKKQDDN